jgi:LysM repeat protein
MRSRRRSSPIPVLGAALLVLGVAALVVFLLTRSDDDATTDAGSGGDSSLDASASTSSSLVTTTTAITTTTVTPTEVTYVIMRGDTLDGIARQFGVTRQALIDANGIENPDQIEAGDSLVIPDPNAPTTTTTTVPVTATIVTLVPTTAA